MPKNEARMESRWRRALPLTGLAAGIGLGAGLTIAGLAAGLSGGEAQVLWVIWFFPLVTGVTGFLLGAFVVEGTGDLFGRIYAGGHTGTRREYSRAQALAIQGQYRAAVAEFEAAADEFDDDPEPLILGARVLRDNLGDLETAAVWLRRARDIRRLEPSQHVTIAQELVDLYDGPLETPEKALPELARVAELFPDTSAGEWAGRRLAKLRTKIWETVKDIDDAPPPERKPPPNPDPTI